MVYRGLEDGRMNRTTAFFIAMAASAGMVGFACSKKQEAQKAPEKDYMVMGELVSPEDSMPRVRYFDDGQVSLNDRCAVRKVKLNPKMPPVYVNGQPIGFC